MKIIEEKDMNNIKTDLEKSEYLQKYLSIDESLNGKFKTYKKDTKILIVGTITPEDGKFYYCNPNAKHNTLDFLFEYFKSEKKSFFVNQKYNQIKDFRKAVADEEQSAIEEIKNALATHKIAFLDVIRRALRVKDSAIDSNLIYATLDYESFEEPLNNNELFIIVNSLEAKRCFEEIFKRVKHQTIKVKEFSHNSEDKYVKISQISRKQKLDELYKLWESALSKKYKS